MTSRDFCYWLQGYFESSSVDANKANIASQLSIEQTAAIKAHLAMVFKHEIDPSFGEDQEALQKLHDRLKGGVLSGPFDTGTKINC